MGHLIEKLFYALGGFARWIYCMFMNIVFDKKYQKNIGFYLFENEEADNSGIDSKGKNFIIGIFVFIMLLLLIGYIEKK